MATKKELLAENEELRDLLEGIVEQIEDILEVEDTDEVEGVEE